MGQICLVVNSKLFSLAVRTNMSILFNFIRNRSTRASDYEGLIALSPLKWCWIILPSEKRVGGNTRRVAEISFILIAIKHRGEPSPARAAWLRRMRG
ncbi:hypothetical protein EVAR_20776_1 [Eumeta japonica]|uniref:Uncharacterized protein n=1 Tax=Eumeta variegata TaxID=151549 RepID=A0A4C1UEQ7_EUMVA|nr:hypothetical protein EVAR_20776_1 [Eumeta japonica]